MTCLINPKIMELIEEEKKLTRPPNGTEFRQFQHEFRAMAQTSFVSGIVGNRTEAETARKIAWHLASCIMLGIRVGKRLERDDKLLLVEEPSTAGL